MKPRLPPVIDQGRVADELFEMMDVGSTTLADDLLRVDPAIYSDPAVAALERSTIFRKLPVIVAHGSEIAEPYDYLTARLPNNEVLVIRQTDGRARAFVNTCRHRGARLVEAERGSSRVHACRFHGWSYDPDGRLRSVLDAGTFGEFDWSCMGLTELPTEVKHGFVWVVDDPAAEIDVGAWLGPDFEESISAFGLDRYVCFRHTEFDEPINWKTLVDGFVDYYHIRTTHARSVAPYFHNNVQIWEELGRHGRHISPRRSIDTVRDRTEGREVSLGEPGLDDHITVSHYVMPNTQIIRQPDHVQVLTFLPDPFDPNRCRMHLRLLVPRPVTSDEERVRWEKNWEILMRVLLEEDMGLARDLQRSVRNSDAQPLVFGRNEAANQTFHKWRAQTLLELQETP